MTPWTPFLRASAAALLLLAFGTTSASADEIFRLEDPALYDLQIRGFELTGATTLDIEAVGRWPRGSHRDWGDMFRKWGWGDEDDTRLSVYAWILDSETRDAVWVMTARDTDREGRSRTLRRAREEIELPAGRYELYFYSGHGWYADFMERADDRNWRWEKSGRYESDLDEEIDEIELDLQDCFVSVSVQGSGSAREFEPDGQLADALVRMTGFEDGELRSQGFRMKSDGELLAYVLVEHPVDDMDAADFAWIVDLDSGEWAWDSSSRRGRYAGGASKNRLFRSRVRLDAGDYVLYYGTDDSHSLERFNANPPYDPLNWGVTLLAGNDFSASDFELFDAPGRGTADIDFSKARDSEFFEQPFRLTNDSDLRIYALGEMDTDGWQFYDYGWIADATSGETVWEMDDRNTYPAGGAEKNRVHDGVVRLPAGDYIAFYVTDGSHSWEEWNAAAPFDPDAWGMSIEAVSGGIEMLSEREIQTANGVLVSMVRQRDHDRNRERFELSEEATVEIYAVGEGLDGRMYDYGWIRDRDSGRTIWEMDYRDTDHAGGARKNRMIREEITLPAGSYEVSYVTDGSHSFEGWNDRRPDDPMSWGIVVRVVN